MTTQRQRVRYTYQDYMQTPDDIRYELIDGELILAAAPNMYHQTISRNLAWLIWGFARDRSLGEVYNAPCDVHLSDSNVVQPDILFISAARLDILTEQNVADAPDMVVEILSPSTANYDLRVKRDLYARFGVREYWLVDPEERTVSVLSLDGGEFYEVARFGEDDTLTSQVVEGLRIDLSEVF